MYTFYEDIRLHLNDKMCSIVYIEYVKNHLQVSELSKGFKC